MPERRITVRGIIFKDGKLFAQKLNGKAFWCTPGGGLEANESLHEGVTRELIEETGIAPNIGKLLYVQQYSDEQKEFIEFFFHITNPEDYHTINLAATTHGLIEVAQCEFIEPAEHNLLPEFLQHANIAAAIETDAPVLVKSYLTPPAK